MGSEMCIRDRSPFDAGPVDVGPDQTSGPASLLERKFEKAAATSDVPHGLSGRQAGQELQVADELGPGATDVAETADLPAQMDGRIPVETIEASEERIKRIDGLVGEAAGVPVVLDQARSQILPCRHGRTEARMEVRTFQVRTRWGTWGE